MIFPALGIFTICLLILMFPSATGLICQKMYSEVHNLAIQELSRNIDKKFRTEPIAQDPRAQLNIPDDLIFISNNQLEPRMGIMISLELANRVTYYWNSLDFELDGVILNIDKHP